MVSREFAAEEGKGRQQKLSEEVSMKGEARR